MTVRPKVYLAGPDVFLPNAADIGRQKKALCERFGLEGLFPFDNEIEGSAARPSVDRQIYSANIAMIRRADAGIFNLTPFRGPSADVGTVFELGFLAALGKPAFGYSNDGADLIDRVKRGGTIVFDQAARRWADDAGLTIEDFGNGDNLMIDACLGEQGDDHFFRCNSEPVGRLDALEGFVACLERACRHFGLNIADLSHVG